MSEKGLLKNVQRGEKSSTPVDGIYVPVKFYCGICRGHYKEIVDQGNIYRMPKYVPTPDGKRVSVYYNEDTIRKAHKSCADKYMNHLRERQGREKKIITGV